MSAIGGNPDIRADLCASPQAFVFEIDNRRIRIGDWHIDELGILTRAIKARD
jgi:hypothetical protein